MTRHGVCRAIGAALLAVSTLLVVPAPALAERSIGVSAASFDFTAAAGKAGVGKVWVSNEGDEQLSVRVYSADQAVDSAGEVSYVAPGLDANPLQSPASWMTITLPRDAKMLGNIPYVDIGPGERVKVTFRVDIPATAVPGDHNIMLFFEMFDPTRGAAGGTARSFGRLGTRVKARVEGEVVDDVSIEPFAVPQWVLGSRVPFEYRLNNRGNVDQRVDVAVRELNRSGGEVASSIIATETRLFAGTGLDRAGEVEAAGARFGPMRVRLTASYLAQAPQSTGLTKSAEQTRSVWLVPAWLPWVAAALVLGVAVLGVRAVSGRSAKREAVHQARADARTRRAQRAIDRAERARQRNGKGPGL